jgi:hypothetical protein
MQRRQLVLAKLEQPRHGHRLFGLPRLLPVHRPLGETDHCVRRLKVLDGVRCRCQEHRGDKKAGSHFIFSSVR